MIQKFIVQKFWDGFICMVKYNNERYYFYGLTREQALDFALRHDYIKTQKEISKKIKV